MLQGGEVIIIFLLALVVFGPTRLPEIARKLGEWTAELRSAARDLRQGLEAEVADFKQITDDLKSPLDEFRKTSTDLQREIDGIGMSRFDWKGPDPISGPTAADAMSDLDDIETGAGMKPQSGPNPGQVMAEMEAEQAALDHASDHVGETPVDDPATQERADPSDPSEEGGG
jgi:TatA/E family protein of Tat protein translocase